MNVLPRFKMFGTAVCEPDGEFEGHTVQLIWLRWCLEVTVATWENRDAR